MNDFLRNERGAAARWIIIVILIAAGVYGYQYFKKTPRYALIQFKKAVTFSNGETAQKYMDFDEVVKRLPVSVTLNQPAETVKKRLIYEINSPHEKSFFGPVKNWSVFRGPVTVSADEVSATAEPAVNTTVYLEKTVEGHWIITTIEIR